METPNQNEKRLTRSAVILAQSYTAVHTSRQALARAKALLDRPVILAPERAA